MALGKVGYREDINALIVELSGYYDFMSTLPFQPAKANAIVFKRVPEDFNCVDLRGFYDSVRGEVGFRDSIVFLTSAPVDDYILEYNGDQGILLVSTAGFKPPVCPGVYGFKPMVGTINIAVVVDRELSPNAIVDLLRVIAEAKSLACVELLLRCDLRSPGTVTDAIAVGARISPKGAYFAGMATGVGGWVSEVTYRRLVELGLKRLGVNGIIYNALGVTIGDLVELAVKAYLEAPVPGVDVEHVRGRVKAILEGILRDPNVLSLIIASRELDLHAVSGSIPGLSVEDHVADSKLIVADELLAFTLSIYIAGFKGLLATYWVERLKERGLLKVSSPQFEDDIVSTLIASSLTLLYNELLGGRV